MDKIDHVRNIDEKAISPAHFIKYPYAIRQVACTVGNRILRSYRNIGCCRISGNWFLKETAKGIGIKFIVGLCQIKGLLFWNRSRKHYRLQYLLKIFQRNIVYVGKVNRFIDKAIIAIEVPLPNLIVLPK